MNPTTLRLVKIGTRTYRTPDNRWTIVGTDGPWLVIDASSGHTFHAPTCRDAARRLQEGIADEAMLTTAGEGAR